MGWVDVKRKTVSFQSVKFFVDPNTNISCFSDDLLLTRVFKSLFESSGYQTFLSSHKKKDVRSVQF